MSRKVHLPRPVPGVLLVDALPLFCGAERRADTLTTCFDTRATCKRCLEMNRRYQEDLDHARTQAKLRALRDAARTGSLIPDRDVLLISRDGA